MHVSNIHNEFSVLFILAPLVVKSKYIDIALLCYAIALHYSKSISGVVMSIEMRLCKCGCGKSKLGTERLKFYSDACKQRYFRANKLLKQVNKELNDD